MTRARPSTFSIVAFDPKTKDLGVAVESKFVAVGAVVPFAAARVGAVATQAYANTAYGRDALAMLKRGIAPKDVVKKLVTEDKEAAQRQIGVVDARGRASSYTGKECFPWAGHVVGRNFAAQGNILAGEEVLKPNVVREIQAGLAALGLYRGPGSGKFDAKTKAAFETWAEMNNYENKLRKDGKVWGSLHRALKAQVAATSG